MKKKVLYASALILSFAGITTARAQCVPVITPASIILCPSESDTLWSDAHDTYQWLQDGNIIAGATNQYFVADANVVSGSMISVVTTTAGCPNATDTSNEVFIDGYLFLPPSVTNITNNYICDNQDSVIFEFSCDSAVQWYFNGVAIPGANNATLVAYLPGIYTVEGAPAQCPNLIMSPIMPSEVTATPIPVLFSDSQAICESMPVMVGETQGNYDSYQWYINGNPISGSNAPVFFTTADGYYHVVATDGNCTVVSDSTFVWEPTPITPAITLVGNTLVCVPGGSQLIDFLWYLNGNLILGALDSTFTPTVAGDYTVSAFDGYCNDTSAVFQYTLSVRDAKANISFQLYPNPSQGDVYISSAEAVSVILLDNVGRVVYNDPAIDKKHQLALGHLAKGIYTIKLTSDKGSAYEKIVIE